MNRLLCAVLMCVLMLPAFLPFAPHEAAHALYEAHLDHHDDTSHHSLAHVDHSHSDTSGNPFITDEDIHHGIPTDIASYYSDFLHVDLRQADTDLLVPLIIIDQDTDFDITANISVKSGYELSSVRSRAPPDTHVHDQDSSSLYLETLRLRI